MKIINNIEKTTINKQKLKLSKPIKSSNNMQYKVPTKAVLVQENKKRSSKKSYNIYLKKNKLHSKNVAYFFFNKDIHIMSKSSFKKHGHYQKWTYFFKRLFGINKNILNYILPY